MRQYYGYESFKEDVNRLIALLKDKNIDAIVSIARGGYTLSHAVAEGLNLRNVQSIRTELYDDTQKREHLALYGRCEFDERVKKVLVLDDIADSGETLAYIMEYMKKNYPTKEFLSATLFYKKTSSYEPDIWMNEAKEWIDFFWERDFRIGD